MTAQPAGLRCESTQRPPIASLRRPVTDFASRGWAERHARRNGAMTVRHVDDIGRWIAVPDEMRGRDIDRAIELIRLAWHEQPPCELCGDHHTADCLDDDTLRCATCGTDLANDNETDLCDDCERL